MLLGVKLSVLTNATIELHHVFSEVPAFGSLRPLAKQNLSKNKIATSTTG